MKVKSTIIIIFLSVIFIWPIGLHAQLQIGMDRQLFLDSFIIGEMKGVKQLLHHPINEGPVLYFDEPWEGNFSGYCTVLKDDGIYKAYYRGVREAGPDGNEKETTCIALSTDGIHWTKPELGLFEVNGSIRNNVILANASPVTHNFSPFIDRNPDARANQRYKALGGNKDSGLIAYTSSDGIHWSKLQENPVFTEGLFDSQNVVFWSESEKQYICYFRTGSMGDFKKFQGVRSVGRTTSTDFINWTEPVRMEYGNTPPEHLYTQQTSPYFRAPQIYIAIGARFMPNRQVLTAEQAEIFGVDPLYFKDCSDAFIMTTRGDNVYDRTFMESFIRPLIGVENWVSRSNYPALNVIKTGPEEMSIYVNESYAQSSAHLKRYSLRIDGFASIQAGFEGGHFITKEFILEGKELEINYATSAAGSILVEILDHNGESIKGYKIKDCQEIIGNEIERIVLWNGNNNIDELKGKRIKLKFVLKDADLYSFKIN